MRCKNVMQSKNTSIELYKIILNTYLFPIYARVCVEEALRLYSKSVWKTQQRIMGFRQAYLPYFLW